MYECSCEGYGIYRYPGCRASAEEHTRGEYGSRWPRRKNRGRDFEPVTLKYAIDHMCDALTRGHWENAESWARVAEAKMDPWRDYFEGS